MEVFTFAQRIQSFWSKVNKAGPVPPLHPEMSNCWIWEGYKEKDGYGRWMIPEQGGQRCVKAHRFAFFLWFGSWPADELDHTCHVRDCVRPDHTKEATRKENANNRVQKTCKRGHPLIESNFYYYGKAKQRRRCRACIGMAPSEMKAS